MSIAVLKIVEGRSLSEKQALSANVSCVLADTLGISPKDVSVLIDEYPTARWSHGKGPPAATQCAGLTIHTSASVAEAMAKLLAN